MDYDLWLKLARRYPIAYLPKVLANYRWLGENKSATGGWQRIDEVEKVVCVVEASRSVEAAADVLRPDIELPGAVRWVRRRLSPISCLQQRTCRTPGSWGSI